MRVLIFGAILSICGISTVHAIDIYNNEIGRVSIPLVRAHGDIYRDVEVEIGSIISVNGGAPQEDIDTYEGSSNKLNIPSVFAFGRVYTNVSISVGKVAGVGGVADAKFISSYLQDNSISKNSYENRRKKYQYFSSVALPIGVQDAHALFKYPDGSIGYLQHTFGSGPWNTKSIDLATPGSLKILKYSNGIWKDNNSIIDWANSVQGCIHPRKVVAADFNLDGVIDFAFACHGWDGPPFPGERGRILLSQSDGTYRLKYQSDDADFKHGATSADINGDGYPDLIVTAKNGANVFINDGTGYFVKSTTYALPQVKNAYHVELVDVNNDGKVDLVIGGHEWGDSTKIIINPGDNNFGSNKSVEIVIPPVPGAGVIVDFLFVKSVNALYILRTGDGQTNGSVFYEGMWLQKFDMTSRSSALEYVAPNWINNGRKWHTWIVEKDGYVMSDYGDSIKVPIK
jgi:hypothetical protein